MKKKSSPFKSSFIGGTIVLTLFSFVFFLIGALVYKSLCKKQENIQEVTNCQDPQDEERDTVVIVKQKIDTVVVYQVTPAPKVIPPEVVSTEKPAQQQKDTKDLKPAIQTPKAPAKSTSDSSKNF